MLLMVVILEGVAVAKEIAMCFFFSWYSGLKRHVSEAIVSHLENSVLVILVATEEKTANLGQEPTVEESRRWQRAWLWCKSRWE